MVEISIFEPRINAKSAKNMAHFICFCKTNLTVFGEDLIWGNCKWPGVAQFSKVGVRTSKNINDSEKLDPEFIDFAKAYFRYQQSQKRTECSHELLALRCIEVALLRNTKTACASNISIPILDSTAQILIENYSPGVAYHGGRELEHLAVFLTNKNLISANLNSWKNPIRRKKDRIQTGSKAKAVRDKMMPSEEALNAMAELFANKLSDPRDVFATATFAMLMCAPSRISEVLALPVDCEIEQKDSDGVMRYGWRFYSGKAFGADIKWIPTEMVGVAKEAVRRVKELTSEARKLARWIESNPDKFYRHQNCPDVSDNALLSSQQINQALGIVSNIDYRLPVYKNLRNSNGSKDVSLSSAWKYVQGRQPRGFPWLSKAKRIKFSDALFCMQLNMLHDKKNTSPVILWKPSANTFNAHVTSDFSLKFPRIGIFDRHGYKADDSSPIKLTSHQVRHMLNTIAQRGGLSQSQIAKWSGRAEVKQNRTYNHMSEYEMVALAEQIDTSMALFGPSGEVVKHTPVSIQEFNAMEKGAIHKTEFGFCVHDFTMSPCEKYRDCENCTEQICIKGDSEKLERLKSRYNEVEQHYLTAKKAMDEGSAGADRWYEHHRDSLKRLKELIEILEDPAVPDGAQIKLRNERSFSAIRRAVESKLNEQIQKDNENQKLLTNLTELLGGGLG